MATITTVRTALEAKLVANLSVDAIVARALARDEKIPVGQTYAAVVPSVVGYQFIHSNAVYLIADFEITVAHHLASSLDHDTYLDGDYSTDQAAMMLPSFFRTLSGVYDVTSDPTPSRISLEGNIIEYVVTVQVSVTL
jgi:hypothetical protein